jgi:hypothetical protein
MNVKTRIALTVLLFFLFTGTAQAGLVRFYSKGMSQTLRTHRNKINLAHVTYVCEHGWGKVKKEHCQAEKWLKRLLAPPATRVVSHQSLWSCITNGAYPGAPHEGNGYNGSYSGPLGMTTPWMGHYPPGSDWVHSDVATVYAIAEEEYRKTGYSSVWLHGQWPQTSPPCTGG